MVCVSVIALVVSACSGGSNSVQEAQHEAEAELIRLSRVTSAAVNVDRSSDRCYDMRSAGGTLVVVTKSVDLQPDVLEQFTENARRAGWRPDQFGNLHKAFQGMDVEVDTSKSKVTLGGTQSVALNWQVSDSC
jgi:hypothetical protein